MSDACKDTLIFETPMSFAQEFRANVPSPSNLLRSNEKGQHRDTLKMNTENPSPRANLLVEHPTQDPISMTAKSPRSRP